MTFRWRRLLVFGLIVIASMASGTSSYATPHPNPCAEMGLDDCPNAHDDAAMPARCDAFACHLSTTSAPLRDLIHCEGFAFEETWGGSGTSWIACSPEFNRWSADFRAPSAFAS